jgi:hypothetical protein
LGVYAGSLNQGQHEIVVKGEVGTNETWGKVKQSFYFRVTHISKYVSTKNKKIVSLCTMPYCRRTMKITSVIKNSQNCLNHPKEV